MCSFFTDCRISLKRRIKSPVALVACADSVGVRIALSWPAWHSQIRHAQRAASFRSTISRRIVCLLQSRRWKDQPETYKKQAFGSYVR